MNIASQAKTGLEWATRPSRLGRKAKAKAKSKAADRSVRSTRSRG